MPWFHPGPFPAAIATPSFFQAGTKPSSALQNPIQQSDRLALKFWVPYR